MAETNLFPAAQHSVQLTVGRPQRTEYLHIIQSTNLDGLMIYSIQPQAFPLLRFGRISDARAVNPSRRTRRIASS